MMTTFLCSSCALARHTLGPDKDLFSTRFDGACRRAGGETGTTNPVGKDVAARTIKRTFLCGVFSFLCVLRGVVPAKGTYDMLTVLITRRRRKEKKKKPPGTVLGLIELPKPNGSIPPGGHLRVRWGVEVGT